jgi:hypothetical protein
MERDRLLQASTGFYRLLSVDPGKNDIAAVSDGVRTLRYTKGQRDENTVKKVRMVHSSKLRKKHKVIGTYEEMKDPSIHDFESKFMSETCKKSSYQRFREYWKRHRILLLNQNLYEKAYRFPKRLLDMLAFLRYLATVEIQGL